MIGKMFKLLVVCFVLSAAVRLAQAQQTLSGFPVASRSEIDCSGFISGSAIGAETFVFDGADNDFRTYFRQYYEGNYVFLHSDRGASQVGNEYRIIRPASGALFGGQKMPLFGHTTWYSGQTAALRSLGEPYEDVGHVRVTAVTPNGAVAQVLMSCLPITSGDLAIPYQAREIPTYNPPATYDRFAPVSESRRSDIIAGARGNDGVLGNGSIAYVSVGASDGAQPGKRYRIFHIDRGLVLGAGPKHTPPTETIGELVILFTKERSSVAIVTSIVRDITVGDGIAPE